MHPNPVVETRALIKDKAIELGDKASDTAEEAYARAEAAALEARDKADKLAKLAKERAGELQQRGQVIIEEQRVKISNVIENARKGGKQDAADATSPSADA